MLKTLTIENFVIIDKIELAFQAGFHVLTGETGAGKSILVDAIGLLLGDKASSLLVKDRKKPALLSAQFEIGSLAPVKDYLASESLRCEPILSLKRTIDQNGRSRCWMNGQVASLSQLRQLGEYLIDIHGQHAHQSLTKLPTQRSLLDAYALAQPLSELVISAWKAWQEALKAYQGAKEAVEMAREKSDRLNAKIQALSPVALTGEAWQALNEEHDRLAHANLLLTSSQEALFALSESESNVLGLLSKIKQALSVGAKVDKTVGRWQKMLEEVDLQLEDVHHELRHYVGLLKEDPEQLLTIQNRLQQILTVAHQYQLDPAALSQTLVAWQKEQEVLSASIDLEAFRQQEKTAYQTFRQLAEALSQKRSEAAKKLSSNIALHLHCLAMPQARFHIALHPFSEPTLHGLESVEYYVATNPDLDLCPLAQVASGGELSRISLAIQIAMSEVTPASTMIFDEIDSGVGGAVSQMIGQRLQSLGKKHQVFAITHLPQVAVYADHHWQVNKLNVPHTQVQVKALDLAARTSEVARMLGGIDITPTTYAHAKEMLLGAQPI